MKKLARRTSEQSILIKGPYAYMDILRCISSP